MHNTNRRLPPLRITLAVVADQSLAYASCMVTLGLSEARRSRENMLHIVLLNLYPSTATLIP